MGYMFTHPIFGVGVNNFSRAEGRSDIITERQAAGRGTKWSVAHSSWVQIGAELGIPGLAALLVFYFGGMQRLKRLLQLARAPDASPQLKEGAALAAALTGCADRALGGGFLYHPGVRLRGLGRRGLGGGPA